MDNSLSLAIQETAEDLQKLIDCSHDALVEIWSMQQADAVKQLRTEGSLTGNPDFAFSGAYDQPGKKPAYRWLQAQMKKRLVGYGGELPVWCLFVRPTSSKRKGDRLLRLEIPKSRMLISFYKPWSELLCIMARLGEVESDWPANWGWCRPYIPIDKIDQQRIFKDQDRALRDADRARTFTWDEQECRASWERMFDLKLAAQTQSFWGLQLQAMVPALLVSDVLDEMPIEYLPY
jgi:hypothetical protein